MQDEHVMAPSRSRAAAAPCGRVVLDDGTPTALVTTYHEARQLLTNPGFSRAVASARRGVRGPALDLSVTEMDPPGHTRIRRLLSRTYGARNVECLRPRIEAIAVDLLDRLRADGPPADLVGRFCSPLTFAAQSELLGIPAGDRDRLRGWSVARSGQPGASREAAGAAEIELHRGVSDVLAELRRTPGGGLYGRLIEAADEGVIDDEELHGIAASMLFDGHFLAATQIANSVLYLLEHPDLLVALRQRPALVGRVVEELLRVCPAVNHSMSRVAVRDVELGGVSIPAGTTVTASLPAANRDVLAFASPSELELREDVRPHLSFGRGIHYCLGAHLARVEIRVALVILLDRLPGLRLATTRARPRHFFTQGACGADELPITW